MYLFSSTLLFDSLQKKKDVSLLNAHVFAHIFHIKLKNATVQSNIRQSAGSGELQTFTYTNIMFLKKTKKNLLGWCPPLTSTSTYTPHYALSNYSGLLMEM